MSQADDYSDRLPYWKTEGELGKPIFNMGFFHRLESRGDSFRVDIGIEVMHDLVTFVRHNQGYRGSVEVILSVLNSSQDQVTREVQRFVSEVDNYESTNSREEFIRGYFTLYLPLGEFRFIAMMMDEESKRKKTVKKKIEFTSPINDGFGVSDMFFTSSSELDSRTNLPRRFTISGRVNPDEDRIYGFLDLLRPELDEPCKLVTQLSDRSDRIVYLDSMAIQGGNNPSSYFIPIPIQALEFGEYEVLIRAQCGEVVEERRRKVTINSFDLPETIRDIDAALEQLEYIAKKREIERIKEAPKAEREKRLVEFWDKTFPTPGETMNGKMLEYYARVDYANQQFSSTRPGWETDRGRVLVIYGRPDEVERGAFDDQGPPYEIWYYNNLGKRFVFKDEYGFGEYRLVTPIW